MTYAIGEVRNFATGGVSASPNFSANTTNVRIETVQKVWNGSAWLEMRDADVLLRQIIKERRPEYSV